MRYVYPSLTKPDNGIHQFRHRVIYALLASAGIVSSAWAQAPAVLETIDVTGDRYFSEVSVGGKEPVKPREIPQSVSVITQERIEDQGLVTVEEALKQVTGITVLPVSADDNVFRSRGHGLNVSFDGVPSIDSLTNHQQLDLAAYERVEVLRGPAGLFQGTGGLGGTVNLVRKRGQREFAASGSVSAGSWNNYGAEADVGGPLNASGSLRGRLVVSGNDRGYFYDHAKTDKYLGYAALDWDITPATTLSVSFASQDAKTKAPSFGLTSWAAPRFGLLDVSRSTNLTTKWSRTRWTTQDTTAELTHRFDSGWNATAKFFHREQDFYTHYGRQSNSLGAAGTLNYYRSESDSTYERDTLDFYVTGPFHLFGQEHRLLLGYNNDRSRSHNESATPTDNVTNIPFGRPDLVADFDAPYNWGQETDTRQSGYYGQLRLRLADPLTVIAGARVSDYRYRSRSVLPATTPWVKGTDEVDDEVTPYAGAVFDVSKEISLYASYSDIFVPQTGQKRDGGALEPNVGEQYEIGGKGEFFGGRLIASLAYFNIKDKNRAFPDPVDDTYSINAGRTESKGWEVEVTGSPAPGWNLSAGYTHLKTKYLKDSNSRNEGEDLNYLNNSDPEHLFKFWGTHNFSGGTLNGLTVGLGATYQSKIQSTNTWGDPPRRTQNGYTVANAFVSYRFDKNLSLSLNVNNLFDKVYYARIGNNRTGVTGNFYGEPRSFLLTLKAAY
jgi:outer membrane receptor for ferric coprogen and ferric-rhodotorulic acid